MRSNLLEIKPAIVKALGPEEGVELVRDMLWAECSRLRISRHRVVVSGDITVKDGGIDASIDADGPLDSALFVGTSRYQIKTGPSFVPWQEAQIKKELFGAAAVDREHLGDAVRRCLDDGGVYALITLGHDLNIDQKNKAEALLSKFFGECGYANARVEVLGVSQVIGVISLHPSLCLEAIGMGSLPFQTAASWAESSDMVQPLALGTAQEGFIADLQSALDSDAIHHVRIVGEPGIGKSRLALESVMRRDDFRANAMYVKQAADFQNSQLFGEILKPGRDYSLLLIIDECDDADRSAIWRALKNRPAVKLVTIDHGPEDAGGQGMTTLQAPQLGTGQIERILASYIGEQFGLSNWSAWCGGSARVAHAIGENLRDHPQDLLRPPGTVPVWDRFISGYSSERFDGAGRVVLRHAALFEKFGARDPVRGEADYIASLVAKVDPSITLARFNEIVAHYRKRRILQGDRTLRIVPKALQVYLWRDWWESYGVGVDVAQMMEEMPKSLYGWFVHPFAYAHDVESARDVVKQLLDPHAGIFADDDFLGSDMGAKFVGVLAEADPASALALLRFKIMAWPDARIEALGEARQHLAWALERIAVWKPQFRQAARMLARLTLGDASKNSNNAKGIFGELFAPIGASTEMPFSDRVDMIIEMIASADPFEREMGLAATAEALNTRGHARTFGVEFQGARARINFWQPKLWDELIAPWRELLDALLKARGADGETWMREVDGVLLEGAQNLIRANVLQDEVVAFLAVLAPQEHNFERAVGLLHVWLRYNPNHLPPAATAALLSLRDQLDGATFDERLRRYVLHTIWDDDYEDDESGEPRRRSASIREDLASEAAQDGGVLLLDVLPKLFASGAYHVNDFALRVAQLAKGSQFDEAVLEMCSQPMRNFAFLWGYLRGVFLSDPIRWQTLAEALLGRPQEAIMRAVAGSGSTPLIFERILAMHAEGIASDVCMLSYGRDPIRKSIGLEGVRRVLQSMFKARASGFYAVAIEIADLNLCAGDNPDPMDEGIVFAALVDPAGLGEHMETMVDHHWGKLAKRFRLHFPHRSVLLFKGIMDATVLANILGTMGHVSEVASDICYEHPAETWPVVARELIGDVGYIFRMWLADVGHYGKPLMQPFLAFRLPDIFEWVDVDPDVRALVVAELVPRTLEKGSEGDMTRAFIERYSHLTHVSETLLARFETGSWTGTSSGRYDANRTLARKWLSETNSLKVQEWLDFYIDALNKAIEQAKIWEERYF